MNYPQTMEIARQHGIELAAEAQEARLAKAIRRERRARRTPHLHLRRSHPVALLPLAPT